MKKLLFLIVFNCLYAQNDTNEIANFEKRSASSKINFAANANTQNYDVIYHELKFKVNPSVQFIAGEVKTTFKALANMNSITFDMANELVVSSVVANNQSLTFSESGNNELIINFPTTVTSGTTSTVTIIYSGVPPANGFDAFVQTTHNNAPIIWTLSEPFGARDWWPCKQDLNDKVESIDTYITAGSQYVGVANGLEISQTLNSDNTKTTHFHHNYPIPAYLIAFAVTNYTIINQTAGLTTQFPIINYVYPETVSSNLTTQLNQTPLIMNFFENTFGTYPFSLEKYGHAQFSWGGGMEHTTVSFMVNFSRQLIAHELAHQWFGDKVTCGSWQDIWLNEGFATYCASLVIENFDGQNAFISDKNNMISTITSTSNGAVYLTENEALDINRIFNSRLSYYKGAMVLNMLRLKMGDTAFFQAVKNYLNDVNLAYKYAKTPQLQAHLETVYQGSLQEFFNDWVYGQGFPTYNITAQNIGNNKVQFFVTQTQSDASVSFFEMPLPIRVYGANNQQQDIEINNTANNQYITADVNFPITSFEFDVKKDIITKNNTNTLADENFELATMILSPNPTKDIIKLQSSDRLKILDATIYNLNGQKILKTANNDTWDISLFASGIYFIDINTNFGEKKLKFVKE